MQTLISVFKDRGDVRRAVQRLLQDGFAQDDLHLKESGEVRAERTEADPKDLEAGDAAMASAEREVAVDRNVLDSLGHFFVSLFGQDRGEKHADTYGREMRRGNSVLVVDARNDQEAESAAVILHDCGAVDVDDQHREDTEPALREVVGKRPVRNESLLADRAGQVSKQMREDREERAYAAPMTHTDRDRPK
jgi:hypothetical protein